MWAGREKNGYFPCSSISVKRFGRTSAYPKLKKEGEPTEKKKTARDGGVERGGAQPREKKK